MVEKLTDEKRKNRVVLFGAGPFLDYYLEQAFSLPYTDIVGISDNNTTLFGRVINSLPIRSIDSFDNSDYDYVVITSTYACEISRGLIRKGVSPNKIKRYTEYSALLREKDICFYGKDFAAEENNNKKILIITPEIGFSNGATMAAFFVLLALKQRGFYTAMAASTGDRECIDYFVNNGIYICVYPMIEFHSYDEMSWMHQYDELIINTYTLSNCIRNLNYPKKAIWWIHETDYYYENEIRLWGKLSANELDRFNIICVSNIALKYFKKYYPQNCSSVMAYGIPDDYNKKNCNKHKGFQKHKKTIFALVGDIYELKGQDIFLQAISNLKCNLDECEFWVIGRDKKNAFCQRVLEKISLMNNVYYLGTKNRTEIMELYRNIDVVVSASRRDMLPIVVTEAMMYGKLIIIPDSIGTADFVTNNKEALIYQTGDVIGLKKAIEDAIHHPDMIDRLGKNARKVYLKHFSLETLGDRIEKVLNSE